jgi:hypothetical protein
LVALGTLATAARADLKDEIQVYADDINAPGEFHLELHLNATPSGRSTPGYPGEITPAHAIRLTPEFSYGVSRDWEAGLYLPTLRDGNGSLYVAGAKLRMKWLPIQPHEGSGAFAGLNVELSQVAARFELDRRSLEARPMLGWRSTQWLVAFNPTLDFALAGPGRSRPADFSPSIKVARTVTDWAAVGLEYYSDLGPVTEIESFGQQMRTLFVAIDVDRTLGLQFRDRSRLRRRKRRLDRQGDLRDSSGRSDALSARSRIHRSGSTDCTAVPNGARWYHRVDPFFQHRGSPRGSVCRRCRLK